MCLFLLYYYFLLVFWRRFLIFAVFIIFRLSFSLSYLSQRSSSARLKFGYDVLGIIMATRFLRLIYQRPRIVSVKYSVFSLSIPISAHLIMKSKLNSTFRSLSTITFVTQKPHLFIGQHVNRFGENCFTWKIYIRKYNSLRSYNKTGTPSKVSNYLLSCLIIPFLIALNLLFTTLYFICFVLTINRI